MTTTRPGRNWGGGGADEAHARPLEGELGQAAPLIDKLEEVALRDAGPGCGPVGVRLLPVVKATVGRHRRRGQDAVAGGPDLQLQVALLMPEGREVPVVAEAGLVAPAPAVAHHQVAELARPRPATAINEQTPGGVLGEPPLAGGAD